MKYKIVDLPLTKEVSRTNDSFHYRVPFAFRRWRSSGTIGYPLKANGTSEIGTDMTKWPSAKHFASWLGLSPNNRITGGRVISSKTKPSANRAAAALRLAANALHRSERLPAPKESPPGSPQGHHRHRPQAGQAHLHHAAVRPAVRGCWRRILRESVSA